MLFFHRAQSVRLESQTYVARRPWRVRRCRPRKLGASVEHIVDHDPVRQCRLSCPRRPPRSDRGLRRACRAERSATMVSSVCARSPPKCRRSRRAGIERPSPCKRRPSPSDRGAIRDNGIPRTRVLVLRCFSLHALQGRDRLAQGNALGTPVPTIPSRPVRAEQSRARSFRS